MKTKKELKKYALYDVMKDLHSIDNERKINACDYDELKKLLCKLKRLKSRYKRYTVTDLIDKYIEKMNNDIEQVKKFGHVL